MIAYFQEEAENINREYNYRCYLKKFTSLGDHVQYAFEAVEGDAITTITPSEHDAGYSLNYEARATANKLNQAVKTIRAYRKRIKVWGSVELESILPVSKMHLKNTS